MKIQDTHNKEKQLFTLWSKLNVNNDDYTFTYYQGDSLRVCKDGKEISVTYANDAQLFRSVLLSAELINDGTDREICEEEQFERKGVMIDLSRAGVMTVDALKNYMEYMALFGLNALMLYMEDVYEVEELPYFGYMRGRYSKEELKEIDRYGQLYGIEVIPCIQTLGHFEQYLKWKESKDFSDTSTVIMPGTKESVEFVDKLLSTISECFTTRLIHIGMDEAWGMGRGKYLKKYGLENGHKLFCDHLTKVKKLTEKYNFKPMIWSDMYFRLASPDEKYYIDNVEFPDYVKELVPKDVMLTYWDYYHKDEDYYKFMINKHRELTDNIVFAGGIWLWAGHLPDYKTTINTTNPALNVCKQEGIKDIYATIWGNDGCETDIIFSLPACVLYGEHAYNKAVDNDILNKRIKMVFGTELNAFEKLSDALYPVGCFSRTKPSVCVKQILYNDIICGIVDYDMLNEEISSNYKKLYEEYKELSKKEGMFKQHFEYVATICKICYEKTDVTIKLHKEYNNKSALKDLADNSLAKLPEDYSKLKELHYKLWHKSYKPFGFEIVDGRYGAAIERIKTAIMRINDYLNGNTDSLPELAEKRLPYLGQSTHSAYTEIASAFTPRGY